MKIGQIQKLPADIRQELDRRLSEGGFGNYAGLVSWLRSEGHYVSRSALGRYGIEIKRLVAERKAAMIADGLTPGELTRRLDRIESKLDALLKRGNG